MNRKYLEYFKDLSEKLDALIVRQDDKKIYNELCTTLRMLNGLYNANELDFIRCVDTLAHDFPEFIEQVKRILKYPMTSRLLDVIIALCYYLHTLYEVRELFEGTVLNKIMKGEEPWSILTTLQQPSTSSNFLKILFNYLPYDDDLKKDDKFVRQKHAFANKLRTSGILPFLIRAKYIYVFLIDIHYLNRNSQYANKETMQTVLVAMWYEWYGEYGEQISFEETGNCLVDNCISISRRESEKMPRFLRRAWLFFWSKPELIDFKQRFKQNMDNFFKMVEDFAFDIVGTEQMLQKELSDVADNVLHGINADWIRVSRKPRNLYCSLISIRDNLHNRLKVTKGKVDDAVLKIGSIEEKELETELQRPPDISKEYIKDFDSIRNQYFGTCSKPNRGKFFEEMVCKIYKKVKHLRMDLERRVKKPKFDSANTRLSDILDTAVVWQTHLEVNHPKIISSSSEIVKKNQDNAIRVWFLEFDPKDTNDALCFSEEKRALCDIFKDKNVNVQFTSSNLSWHPLMSAWTGADILYISGHSYQEFKDQFDFESEWSGEHVYRSKERVRDGFELLPTQDPPKLVVLSQCRSEKLGEWFVEHRVPFVVVTKRQFLLNDQDAFNFLNGFFLKLVENKTIPEAFDYGRNFVVSKTKEQEGCCCQFHEHACKFCRKHQRYTCCRGVDCRSKNDIYDDCPCAAWLRRKTCCEPNCSLDPKDRFKILKGISVSSQKFRFMEGSLEKFPIKTEQDNRNNIQPLEKKFQRHTEGKSAVGEILVLLKKGNKVVVVHSNGEPGLGKKQTCLAVCHHLLRNYLSPYKPPWQHGIWQIEQKDIEMYLSDEKLEEVITIGVNPGFKLLEWLWVHLSWLAGNADRGLWKFSGNSGTTIMQKWQKQGDVLIVLFAPNNEDLLRQLFKQLRAAKKSLPEYMQFIVTCREPPKDLDTSFPQVAIEPLSYKDGTRLFKQVLMKMNKWGQRKINPPPDLKFHDGHKRDRFMYESSLCCKRMVKGRRRFLCMRCKRTTCESCWANWEITYFFVNRKKAFNPLEGDVPLSDSNLPEFGDGIKKKCAKSEKDYREILRVIDEVRFYHLPKEPYFEKLPAKLQTEIKRWYKNVEKCKRSDKRPWYDLACCPSNSFEARTREGNLYNHCLKCREIKYYIRCQQCKEDLCEYCWIQDHFHKGDIPLALANRNMWSWTRNSAWRNECAKYFCCLFLRGNPRLIKLAAELLNTEVGDFKCTINTLIELVYTFIDKIEKEPKRVEKYLRGHEMVWVANRGCFPKKLSKICSKPTCDNIKNFLKLLYKVQCPSAMKGRQQLRQLNISM